MDPQSLDLQGFPEARVEMKVAPFRALTQFLSFPLHTSYFRRNEGRPFQGIDTSSFSFVSTGFELGRNEGRPIQGIDTNLRHYSFAQIYENS